MPFYQGKDKKGNFLKWNKSGKKFYYTANNKKSRRAAEIRAIKSSSMSEKMKRMKLKK